MRLADQGEGPTRTIPSAFGAGRSGWTKGAPMHGFNLFLIAASVALAVSPGLAQTPPPAEAPAQAAPQPPASPSMSPQPAPSMSPQAAPAGAPQASGDALEAARELVTVISEGSKAQMISNLTAQVWPSIEQSLRAQNPKVDAAASGELRQEYERLLTEDYNKIMSDAPAIYARYLTAQEIRDVTAFYRTPSGAKALQVMPQATAEISAMSLERLQGLQERVYLAFLNILQKRGLFAN